MSRKIVSFVGFVMLLMTGCASMGLNDFFQGYTKQMLPVTSSAYRGDFQQALSNVPNYSPSHNAHNLTLMEKGRLYFLNQDWQQSKKMFAQAYSAIEAQNNKAKLQISRGVENLGAVVSNDSALSYRIPTYEQTMLHSYQALNYVFSGDLEGALVEIRRANLVQERALKTHEDEIFDAQESLKSKGMDINTLYSSYPSMDKTIGSIKNGFQNAFTFYLSAVLYEASGEFDSAYIDYKRAIDIFPDNSFVQHDVIRLAKKLGREQELERFLREFPITVEADEKGAGDLVIFLENQLVPAKQEAAVNLPIFTRHDDMRFFSFALPVYRSTPAMLSQVNISSGQVGVTSENLVDLVSLASMQLKEQLPEMVTRQAVRILAKEELRRKMKKEGGDVGNILAGLYSIATERADTRSWITLPNNIAIARIKLPPGQHVITFEQGGTVWQETVDVKAKRTSLMNVSLLNRHTSAKSAVL